MLSAWHRHGRAAVPVTEPCTAPRLSLRRAVVSLLVSAAVLAAGLSSIAMAARPAAAALPKDPQARNVAPLQSSPVPKRHAAVPAGDFRNPPGRGTPPPAAGGTFDPAKAPLVSQSATANIYQNSDGTNTALIHAQPINYQDPSGGWHAIDDTLAAGGDGRQHNHAGPLSVSFAPRTGAGDLVQVASGSSSVGFSLAGATPGVAANAIRNSADYAAVADGVDLVEAVQGGRVKETIVLTHAPSSASPGQFDFPLHLANLVPSSGPSGSVVLKDNSGAVVFTVPSGTAMDSSGSGHGPGAAAPATVGLIGSTGNWSIRVSVDPAWLAASTRVYPVMVDPTLVYPLSYSDAWVDSYYPTYNFNSNPNYAGTWYSGYQFYTFAYYDLSAVMGKNILRGAWNGYETASYCCQGNSYPQAYPSPTYDLRPLTSSFSPVYVTWNTKPTYMLGQTILGQATAAGQWQYRDMTTWVANWASSAWANDGIQIDTGGSANDGFLTFSSDEGSGSLDSYLQITYGNPVPVSAQQSPPDTATVMSATPTLTSAPVSDPDGDTVQYFFDVGSGANCLSGEVSESGWLPSPSWTLPAGIVQDGATYHWCVFTWDTVWTTWPTNATYSFKVNLRLGDQSVSPTDTVGPVTVNLANGNAVVHHATPQHVHGAAGVEFFNQPVLEGPLRIISAAAEQHS